MTFNAVRITLAYCLIFITTCNRSFQSSELAIHRCGVQCTKRLIKLRSSAPRESLLVFVFVMLYTYDLYDLLLSEHDFFTRKLVTTGNTLLMNWHLSYTSMQRNILHPILNLNYQIFYNKYIATMTKLQQNALNSREIERCIK